MKKILLVLPLALVGCAPTSVLSVKELGPERQYAFTVEENYQSVYRKIVNQERKCYESISNALNGQFIVRADLYQDLRSGTISTAQYAGYGLNIWRVIEVESIDSATSKVKAYLGIGPVEKGGQLLKQWVLDNSQDCSLKT